MDVMSVVHHLTYEHIGNEPLEDLQGLCRGCHEFLSAEIDIDPADRVMHSLGFASLLEAGVTEEAVDRAIRRTVGIMYSHTVLAPADVEASTSIIWEFTRARLRGEDPHV